MIQHIQINDFIHLNYFGQPEIKKLELEITLHHGGSFFEKPNDRGKKHLMEHCIATRISEMNKDEFKAYQFANNMMVNAFTSPTMLGVSVATHIVKYREALNIGLEMLLCPTFDQEVLDQEKEIVLREITERRGSPDYKAWFLAMGELFEPDSLENHQTLGDSKMVAQTTVDDMIRLHKDNLTSSQIIINLSGPSGVDLEFLKERVNYWINKPNSQYSAAINKLPKVELNYNLGSKFLEGAKLEKASADYCHQECELQIFLPVSFGYEDLATVKIFSELYFRFYGKVYDKLRDQKGYIYSMHSEFRPKMQQIHIVMSCELEYVQPILDEIKLIFSDFEANFDEVKFNQFKEIMYLKTDLSTDESEIMMDFVQYGLMNYNKVRDIFEFTKQIESVTKEQVHTLFDSISKGWQDLRLIVTSKNPEVENLELKI